MALASTVTPGSINISDGTIPVATSLTLEAWVRPRHLRRGQLRGPLRERAGGPQLRRGPRLGGRGVLHHAPLRRLGRALQPRLGPWLQRLLVRLGVRAAPASWETLTTPTAGLVRGPERRLVPPRGTRTIRRPTVRRLSTSTAPRSRTMPGVATACLEAAIPQYGRLGTDSNGRFSTGWLRPGPHVVRGPVGKTGSGRATTTRATPPWVRVGSTPGGPPTGTLRGGRRHRLPGPEPLRRRPRHVQPAVDRQHGGLFDRQRHLHRHQRILRGELPRRRLAERQPRPRRSHHDRRHRLPGVGRGQRDAAATAHPVHRHDRPWATRRT